MISYIAFLLEVLTITLTDDSWDKVCVSYRGGLIQILGVLIMSWPDELMRMQDKTSLYFHQNEEPPPESILHKMFF